MEIKTLLEEEIHNELEGLGDLELGSSKYKIAVDGMVKLTEQLVVIEKFESEGEDKIENREIENNLKQQQADDERKDRVWRNGISIASIIVPTIITIWGTCKTLKFEETGTITTSMGRGFINKLLPKK